MLLEYLQKEFDTRSRRNPHYSVRAFAKSMQVNSGTLSQILSGQRPITTKTAVNLLQRLEIDPATQNQILLSLIRRQKHYGNLRDGLLLEEEALEILASWESYAILSLLEAENLKPTVRNICRRLKIGAGIAYSTLKKLERLDLVEQKGTQWRTLGKNLSTRTDLPSLSLRRIHSQFIKKALESLEKDPVLDRDITGSTLTISKEKLPLAKRRIAEFRKEMASFLESGRKQRVYRLNIQLFPIDEGEKNEK